MGKQILDHELGSKTNQPYKPRWTPKSTCSGKKKLLQSFHCLQINTRQWCDVVAKRQKQSWTDSRGPQPVLPGANCIWSFDLGSGKHLRREPERSAIGGLELGGRRDWKPLTGKMAEGVRAACCRGPRDEEWT